MNFIDKGMIDWNEVLDKAMNVQLNTVRHNDWEMKGLDGEQKVLVLEYLKTYFVKIENYELCNEIQIQLDKIQSGILQRKLVDNQSVTKKLR